MLAEVQRAFPGKPIVIGEVGWPSEGRTRESAVATTANEALFLRRFLAYAEQQRLEYFVMEAFDQPWKAAAEGKVGAYWGVYDADRQQKFEFRAPIVRVPHWHVLAAASVLAAAFMLWLFYFHSHSLRNRGRSFLAVVVYATATLLVWTLYDFSQQYLTVGSVLVGAVLMVGMLGRHRRAVRGSARMGRGALGGQPQSPVRSRRGCRTANCRAYRSTSRPTTSRRTC